MIRTKIENTRLHLREEKDGTGMLIINASQILYLDRIGKDFAKHYIRYMKKPPLVGSVRDNVVMRMMLKYRVKKITGRGRLRPYHVDHLGHHPGECLSFYVFRRQAQRARVWQDEGAHPHRHGTYVPL